MMSKRIKCKMDGRFIKPCETLEKSFSPTEAENVDGIGLLTIKTNRFEPKATMAAIYSGDFVDRGIVVNYCPFCGVQIAPEQAKKKK